jgi:hypothetical protein
MNFQPNRADWLKAQELAKNGGRIRPTLANLVAAYRCVKGRWPDLGDYA